MSNVRDPNTVIAAWLDEGPTELPNPNRGAIVAAARTITQRRRGFGSPWRDQVMNGYTRAALTATAVVVAAVGAIYLLSPGQPSGSVGGPGASPTPTPTPRPSPVAIEAGTITLTDEGCTWIGNPSPVAQPVILTIDVVNETDTFASFDLYRLTAGTWDDAAAWILAEHEAYQTDPGREIRAADFAEQITDGFDAVAFAKSRLTHDVRIPGTYGVVCSSNEPPPGAVFGIYLVGPLWTE